MEARSDFLTTLQAQLTELQSQVLEAQGMSAAGSSDDTDLEVLFALLFAAKHKVREMKGVSNV